MLEERGDVRLARRVRDERRRFASGSFDVRDDCIRRRRRTSGRDDVQSLLGEALAKLRAQPPIRPTPMITAFRMGLLRDVPTRTVRRRAGRLKSDRGAPSARDVRPLRESLAEGDVLAGHLIDQDDEVVRPQTGLLHDEPVERGEQREALLLRATNARRFSFGRPEMKVSSWRTKRSLYLQPTKAGVWTNCPFGRTWVMRK
jgi:hypothetical protein